MKYEYDTDFFKEIDTEEKAYWLGFLYADGCITKFYKQNHNGEKVVRSMSCELGLKREDKVHLENFVKALNSNLKIQDRKSKLKDKIYYSNRVVVNSTQFCKNLIEKGCLPKKSLILRFPDEEIVNESLLRHFIRGYFDGDGCVFYKEYQYEWINRCFRVLICGNDIFLKSLCKILEKNEIKVTQEARKDKRSNVYQMFILGFDNLKLFYNYIYENNNICLERKYQKFNYAFERINKLPL
jgi:hypothetical protein